MAEVAGADMGCSYVEEYVGMACMKGVEGIVAAGVDFDVEVMDIDSGGIFDFVGQEYPI